MCGSSSSSLQPPVATKTCSVCLIFYIGFVVTPVVISVLLNSLGLYFLVCDQITVWFVNIFSFSK